MTGSTRSRVTGQGQLAAVPRHTNVTDDLETFH